MTKLYGADADRVLAARWHGPQQRLPDGTAQEVIHVHRPSSQEPPSWALKSPAFLTWQHGGPRAIENALEELCQADGWVPYVTNARLARAAGTTITRIFILPRTISSRPGPADWRNYQADVLFPFFAAKAGEELILVWREAFEAAPGLPPLRDMDVNRWGAACIMLTGYAPDGEVAWREFLDLDAPGAEDALNYLATVVTFARAHGARILPARVPV